MYLTLIESIELLILVLIRSNRMVLLKIIKWNMLLLVETAKASKISHEFNGESLPNNVLIKVFSYIILN